jgi:glutamyl-tRNA reductase
MRVTGNKAVAHIRTQDAAADWSMKGKTVLFTGASRGMGRFAAIELARLGAEILVVGRNEGRGAAAVQAIRSTGGSAQFLRADMGDAAEVCALATAMLVISGERAGLADLRGLRSWRSAGGASVPLGSSWCGDDCSAG